MNPEQPESAATPSPVQEELGISIPKPTPIPTEVAASSSPAVGTLNAQFNYNFSIPAVQLPDAESLAKYPQAIQEFFVKAAAKEQDARHAWMTQEQTHRHTYDREALNKSSHWQIQGQILGFLLSVICILAGTCIIILGKSLTGFVPMLLGIASLVGTAVYRIKASAPSRESTKS